MAPLSNEMVAQLKDVGTERQELLQMTGEQYVCCAGLCPCGPLAEPQNENCVYAEACCCLGLAITGNRWMLQTRYLKQNDPCDDCLICCNAALGCVACLLRATGADDDLADAVTCISDVMNMCVISCMLAQHQMEMEHIKENNVETAMERILDLLPPKQQQMVAEAAKLKK